MSTAKRFASAAKSESLESQSVNHNLSISIASAKACCLKCSLVETVAVTAVTVAVSHCAKARRVSDASPY